MIKKPVWVKEMISVREMAIKIGSGEGFSRYTQVTGLESIVRIGF